MAQNFQIRQQGNIIFSGDKISIMMIFNNLTGKNFKDNKVEYLAYKKLMKEEGFNLNKPFSIYEGDIFIKSGIFV